MEHNKDTEDKLRILLKKLRSDIALQKNVSNIQRVIHELRIYQVEQELKGIEFQQTRRQLTETSITPPPNCLARNVS